MTARATVVVAEDHAVMAQELCAILESEYEVVACVSDGVALVDAARRLAPDCVVTDVSMPGMDGLTAAAEILRDRPAAPFVFVSIHREIPVVKRAIGMGACAYVLKHEAADELVPAVEAVLLQKRYLSPGLRGP